MLDYLCLILISNKTIANTCHYYSIIIFFYTFNLMSNEINRLKLAQFGNLELLAKQVVEGFFRKEKI